MLHDTPDYPVFQAVIQKIKFNIVTGVYRPGSRLPSYKDLSTELAVNPSAVITALHELNRIKLLESGEADSFHVTQNMRLIAIAKFELAKLQLDNFLTSMNQLKCTDEQIASMLIDNTGLFDFGGKKS